MSIIISFAKCRTVLPELYMDINKYFKSMLSVKREFSKLIYLQLVNCFQ